MSNILATLSNQFFTVPTNSAVEDNASYGSKEFWGACLVTLGAGLCLASTCLKRREVRQLTIDDYLNDPNKLSKLQKAEAGTIPVYLGKGFVIKHCVNAVARFRTTDLAIQAIQKHNYSHLIVPKILQRKNTQEKVERGRVVDIDAFSVEQRLPICGSIVGSEKIYEEHRDAFAPAVLQFANLLMRYTFTDLLCRHIGPTWLEIPYPRYDNVCPYLENGEGKLGLVDVEHFEIKTNWCNPNNGEIKYCNLKTCNDLIHLFPHHFEEIIQLMEKEGLQLSTDDRKILEVVRNDQLEDRKRHAKNMGLDLLS